MKKSIALALAVMAMGTAHISQAALVTVSFSAVVTSPGSVFASTGSNIQGTITFGDEPSRSDLIDPGACASVGCASYLFDAAPTRVDVTTIGAVISSTVLGVGVYDNTTLFTPDGSPVDAVELGARTTNAPFYILNFTGSPNSFSGAALPDAVAALSTWQNGQFSIWLNPAAGPTLQARVTEFKVTSVPEPAAMVLFALGACGVAAASARQLCRRTRQAVDEA